MCLVKVETRDMLTEIELKDENYTQLCEKLFNSGLFEANRDCLKILDIDGRLEFINVNGCELMEIDDPRTVVGLHWSSFWPPEDQQMIKDAIATACEGHQSRFEAYRPTAKGSPRWWNISIDPIKNSHGKITHIIASSRDITEQKMVGQALRDSKSQLNHAADAGRLTYLEMDSEHHCLKMAENFSAIMGYKSPCATYDGYGLNEAIQSLLCHVVPGDLALVKASIQKFFDGNTVGNIQFSVKGDDDIERSFESVWAVKMGSDGAPLKTFVTIRDISENRRIEKRSTVLAAEVNHRTKNMLSVVQAIARQTARKSDPELFAQNLSDRIASLSASQDLLTKNKWEGVGILETIEAQLMNLTDLIGTRIFTKGPAAKFNVAATQGIGMALHELSTNAAKYGALSNDNGRVFIEWDIVAGAEKSFVMSWKEDQGPEVNGQRHAGFGDTVIGPLAEAAVQGIVETVYTPAGLTWTITAPVEATLQFGQALASN